VNIGAIDVVDGALMFTEILIRTDPCRELDQDSVLRIEFLDKMIAHKCFFNIFEESLALISSNSSPKAAHLISAFQFVPGNESSVLGLLWRIKQHFFAAADYIDDTIDDEDNNNISADVNMSPAKQQCLAWLKHRVWFQHQNECPSCSHAFLHLQYRVLHTSASSCVLLLSPIPF